MSAAPGRRARLDVELLTAYEPVRGPVGHGSWRNGQASVPDDTRGPAVRLTLTDPLTETLHSLLARHTARERNKELALALVESANRGEPCPLTAPFAADRPLLACDRVIADGDHVALRLTATTGTAVSRLLAELRFDGDGRLVEHHAAPLPAGSG
ncbi:hypothetical protein [Streptomyces sp. NPDC050504]|uniref:hypothetical protein n=1 Tax=Streptomyces sp. NPDC050504 TaxID=3365618 RepID=UPI0037AB87FE